MNSNDASLSLTTLLLLLWLWQLLELLQISVWRSTPSRKPRQLRPRIPHDCPYCCGMHLGRCAREVGSGPLPIPWSQVKSPRGRKKKIDTDGYACRNKACVYYGIRNDEIHALIGYGSHGKCEKIQDFFCQACQKKVTSRWGTIMYKLKTATKRVSEVMTALAEGLSTHSLRSVQACPLPCAFLVTAKERCAAGSRDRAITAGACTMSICETFDWGTFNWTS